MPKEADNDSENKKPHRNRRAGRKAEKKKNKTPHVQDLTDRQRNPKAFAIQSAVTAERRFRRKQDLKTKKEHIPVVDRTPLEPPPILVSIVGPPKVGKTSVIRSLVKSFTRQPLTKISGPITVVSGKKRRITFVECNNDINSMVDLAKVSDLVLLLIDASFGFEMEIFEFLNICQVHGMPRIMGVLTHLDMIKQIKKLRRTKKLLKRRFWTEVYPGAKLFYLSGMVRDDYLKNEVKNLARFISVMKFRPLTWQTTHSYVLGDRLEDITPPDKLTLDPKIDRKICIYGYMRGIPMNKQSFIHIPGCGDFPIEDISFLPDPCPLPEVQKKRSLIDKERLIYAPFSGVGGIIYDKDAVYIDMPYQPPVNREEVSVRKKIISDLVESHQVLADSVEKANFKFFSTSEPITNEDYMKFQTNWKTRNEATTSRIEKHRDEKDDPEGKPDKELVLDKLSDVDFSEDDTSSKNESIGFLKSDEEVDNTPVSGAKRTKEASGDSMSEDDQEIPVKKKKVSKNEEIKLSEAELRLQEAQFKGVQNDKDKEIHSKISSLLAEFDDKIPSNNQMNIPIEGDEELSSESESGDEDVDVEDVPWERRFDSDCEEEEEDVDIDDDDDDDLETDCWKEEKYISKEDKDEDASGSESSEEEDLENTDLKWKENIAAKAEADFYERQSSSNNLWKLVYGDTLKFSEKENEDESEDEVGGIFKVVRNKQETIMKAKDAMDVTDSSKFQIKSLKDWTSPDFQEFIKDCFITGKWKMEEDASELLKLDNMSDEEVEGDFEDLETGKKVTASKKSGEQQIVDEKDKTKQDLLEKKRKLKEKFDMEYDNVDEEETHFDEMKSEANRQAQLNKNQFEGLEDSLRVELEGFRPGMYVRMELNNVPCELVDHFDPSYPLIVGGLQPGEQNIGYVKARIKKHRWYSKILKTRDPIILSVGWRRFQTISVYSKQEDNMRHRMLKYTPKHLACMTHFWGPITKTGTGFLVLKDAGNMQLEPGFRIVATGTVLETNQSTIVTKKLKLIGEPYKIYKKSAFIKGMFNSVLEVAKFEGARIKTVSGIRGTIKKAESKPAGAFRATFEDKILLSDIVFCRTWYQVDIPKFYAPITSLLLPPEERFNWQGMKTVAQLKKERNIRNERQPDSLYTKVKRHPKKEQRLIIPRALEKELPFRFKVTRPEKTHAPGTPFSQKINKVVIRNDHDSKVSSMMNKLRMNFKSQESKRNRLKKAKMNEYVKSKKAELLYKSKKHKEIKKRIYRTLGQTTKKPSI